MGSVTSLGRENGVVDDGKLLRRLRVVESLSRGVERSSTGLLVLNWMSWGWLACKVLLKSAAAACSLE